jgi:hypothetical protein
MNTESQGQKSRMDGSAALAYPEEWRDFNDGFKTVLAINMFPIGMLP